MMESPPQRRLATSLGIRAHQGRRRCAGMRRAFHIYTCIYTHIHLLCTLALQFQHCSTLYRCATCIHASAPICTCPMPTCTPLLTAGTLPLPACTPSCIPMHPPLPISKHPIHETCERICAGSGTATRAETAQYSARAHRAHPQNTVRRHSDAAAHVHLFVPVVQVGDLLHAQLDGGKTTDQRERQRAYFAPVCRPRGGDSKFYIRAPPPRRGAAPAARSRARPAHQIAPFCQLRRVRGTIP